MAGRRIPALDYKRLTDWSRMLKTSRHFLHSAFTENAQNKKDLELGYGAGGRQDTVSCQLLFYSICLQAVFISFE